MTGEGIVRGPERVAESRSGKAVVCCYLLPGFRFFWGLCKINIPPLTLGMLEDFFFPSSRKLRFLFNGEFDNFKNCFVSSRLYKNYNMFKSDQF